MKKRFKIFYILHSAFCIPCGGRRATAGFTLIELMIVITILVVLMGMLFPVILGIKNKERNSKAQAEVNKIAMAIRDYKMTFEKFPGQYQLEPWDATYFTNNYVVVQPLLGDNPLHKTFLFIQVRATNVSGGVTSVVGQTDAYTNYVDPWGVPYVICQSEDGDQNCTICVTSGYQNIYSVPANYNIYVITNYSVPNQDVAVASFGGTTNSLPFNSWSGN